MINLDDHSIYKSKDSLSKVIESIDAFPKQLNQAWKESSKIEFPESYHKTQNVVVCGMGGSRFTPLAVKELLKEYLTVPYVINDNYTLPGFVNKNTLVILSSYSGTTEEVMTCAEEALSRKSLLTAVTSGESLTEILSKKYPHYVFNPIHNPSNQPRIGLGYMLAGHIGIIATTGLLTISREELDKKVRKAIENAGKTLRKCTISTPKSENRAKQLAQAIYHKYPYIVTSEFLQGFGNAFGNALNETAKNISSPRVIPEINHHLMEGLKFPDELKKIGLFIFFYSTLYHERVQKRFKITREVVENNELQTYWYELAGETKEEQLFEALGFSSYVTLYLSILYDQDPSQIPWVDMFKKKLKE